VSGKPNFDEILLEYVQTFVYSLLYNPTIKCDARGRALVLGLGAGTMASVIHSHLENYIVDVFEVSEDVRRAAEGFLGTPTNDDRFKLHMRDAALAFEGAPANLKYDLIVFDAYMPGPRMPDSLVTQEYISLLASRLTPSGVFVLNFCLPYYNMDAQIEIMERYRKAYKHLHFLEATPTSRIVIGYNFSRARSPSDVLEQHLSMHESSCHWPGTTRAAMYEVYLPAVNWHSSWRRFPHNEATEYYCTQELRVDRQYCSWFLKRDKLWKLAPEAHFASMEQEHALREAKGDVKLAAQIARRLIREKKEKSGQN
jgi:hypothetical protein